MKKFLASILTLVMILSFSASTFAAEFDHPTSTEQFSVSDALSDPEIVSFLNETGEMEELLDIQNDLAASLYECTANNVNSTLGISDITPDDIQRISDKYDLSFPSENNMALIDNGTINVIRDTFGLIVDVWYLYYPYSDSFFSVNAALIDSNNTLDSVGGSIALYYLNNSTWTQKETKYFRETSVTNGVVYKWSIAKWGVKEKFEYRITVVDNGTPHHFNNVGENDCTRYNFAAMPYTGFKANGGQRHHFIPASSLKQNGFSTNTAYCIRMLTSDHERTGSFGSSTYVSKITNYLKNKQYEQALQHEVDDLKTHPDSEGTGQNLQQKYYNEVIICLIEYEYFFGIK